MIGIFKITNRKGHVYIGKSTDVHKRIKALINSCGASCPLLYRSFVFYGIERHHGELIEECQERNLLEREAYWIRRYSRKTVILNTVKYQYKNIKCNKCGKEHFIKNRYIESCKIVAKHYE